MSEVINFTNFKSKDAAQAIQEIPYNVAEKTILGEFYAHLAGLKLIAAYYNATGELNDAVLVYTKVRELQNIANRLNGGNHAPQAN